MTSVTVQLRSDAVATARPLEVRHEDAQDRARSYRRISNDEILQIVIGWAKETGIEQGDLLPAVAIVFEELKQYPAR